jgi:hypothetical protein
MRAGIWVGVAVVLVLGLVGCGHRASQAKRPPTYLRVRYLPAAEPSLYLEFRDRELRVAASPKGLAAADPVRPKHVTEPGGWGFWNSSEEEWMFPAVTLPGAPSGTKAKATLTYQFTPFGNAAPGAVTGEVVLTVPDAKGQEWRCRGVWDEQAGGTPEESECVDVPSPQGLRLMVQVRPQGRSVGVEVSLANSSGEALASVDSPHGAKPVLVQVWDEKEKQVHSHRGALSDFGST